MEDKDKRIFENITKIIPNYNINFLIGAGCSFELLNENEYNGFPIMSFFSNEFNNLLGKKEEFIREISENDNDESYKIENNKIEIKNIESFIDFLSLNSEKNKKIIDETKSIICKIVDKDENWYFDKQREKIAEYYKELASLIKIFKKNYNFDTKINKKINIFNLNYDLFCEYFFDFVGLQYNDGFQGKLIRKYNENEFDTSLSRENNTENIINFFKLHGSIDWYKKINTTEIYRISKTIDVEIYERAMVLPTNDKYINVFENHIFSMLQFFKRSIYSKKNILFILGTSLSDNHIKESIISSCERNADLIVVIFAYKEVEFEDWNKIPNVHVVEKNTIEALKFMKENFFYKKFKNEEIFDETNR